MCIRDSPITCAVAGGLLGFLLFNVYPASVFMGDTGSLALGGFVAGTAYMMQMPLFIPIVGFIYAVELLSVVIQVSYFKATHGKRIFKMAPIHHHFELCGWSETRVVAVFSIITALLLSLIHILSDDRSGADEVLQRGPYDHGYAHRCGRFPKIYDDLQHRKPHGH